MRTIYLLFPALCLAFAGCHPADIVNPVPGPPGQGDDIDGPQTEIPVPDGMNLAGTVVDIDGNGISGVVVTDGRQCTETRPDGTYFMKVDPEASRFIHISTPSGYMPVVRNGLPVFYKLLSRQRKVNGVYQVEEFLLSPVQDPGRATVFFTADPQPRASGAGYDQGLTDELWAWLQADLSHVPKTKTIATCSHSPMFKTLNGERSARHKDDYAALLTGFAKVHAWAGHTHATHNYVYPAGHKYEGLEVHTLARSTGELWTNEYLSSGTPRGYTIAEIVDGEFASWRFHPVKYQRGAFIGPAVPSYELRDWDYDDAGVARMKAGGGVLDESYQMHLYAPVGTYGDSKVYANIFLWDSKWSTPVFTLDGGSPVQMVPVESASRYDFADTAFKTFYKTFNQTLKDYSGYDATTTGNPNTLFSTPVEALSGSGTVSVTDRFGKVYTARISW